MLARTIHSKGGAIRALAARHGAANPRLFGSVARGDASGGSDVDLLVDALPGATLFDLGALQQELEALLGASVDLVTPGDLHPAMRETVLAEARPV